MPDPRFKPILLFVAAVLVATRAPLLHAETEPRTKPLEVGEKADDFTLHSLRDEDFTLSEHLKQGPVVVLVLRGYPGYQCPICSRQVGDYLANAEKFADLNAQIVMIYPGPSEELQARAEEFVDDRAMPENFHFLIDPDYEFTNLYALRWDEPRETAYPSTFVLDEEGVVQLAVISHSHRGRTKAAESLKALGKESGAAEVPSRSVEKAAP